MLGMSLTVGVRALLEELSMAEARNNCFPTEHLPLSPLASSGNFNWVFLILELVCGGCLILRHSIDGSE